MVDVAREAGVAHVTVSRVLNNHPSVKPETRERVLAGSQLYGLPEILLGVEQAATAAGYWVQMSSAQGSSAPKFTEAVNRLTGVATEGVAMIADRPVAIEALETMTVRVPMSVIMSGPLGNPAIASVELDQFLGSRAIETLVDVIGGGTPRHHLIDPALVLRSSIAPPRQ